MSRIFLSYSTKDKCQAIALKHWLETSGWEDVFMDDDLRTGIAPGESWKKVINDNLERCEVIVCLITPDWHASKWCFYESQKAEHLQKRIIHAILEDVVSGELLGTNLSSAWQTCRLDCPGPMMSVQILHNSKEYSVEFSKDGLRRLQTGLEKAQLRADYFPWPPKDDQHRSPFRGLEPLDVSDAGVYFGRDVEILKALESLRKLQQSSTTSILAILGASGTGKSSFLRAGLLPRLARDDHHFFPLDLIRPEDAAITGRRGLAPSLAAALKQFKLADSNPGVLKAKLRPAASDRHSTSEAEAAAAAEREFVAILRLLQDAVRSSLMTAPEVERPSTTLVLAVDQAEELFSSEAGPEARAFLRFLAAAQSADAICPKGEALSLIVVFTISSDRYEPLQNAPELVHLKQEVFSALLPMPKTRFAEVIKGPARRASKAGTKLVIQPELVEELVRECEAGADTLPLLSLTLRKLHEDFGAGGELNMDNYQILGGLRQVVQTQVEAVLALDPKVRAAQLAILRRAFIPALVAVSLGSEEPQRRVGFREKLPDECLPLLDALKKRGILLSDFRDGKPVYEIAHEALFRHWKEFQLWLAEERDNLKEADALQRESVAWSKSPKDEFRLWRGKRLEDASMLADRPDFAPLLAECKAFLARSREVEVVESERLSLLQQSQTKSAQELVEERRRKRRWLLMAAPTLLMLIIGLLYSLKSNREATRTAQANRINSFYRSIGIQKILTPDECNALWELAELPEKSEPVRTGLLQRWAATPESSLRSAREGRGLNAGLAIRPDIDVADVIASNLTTALGKPSQWHEQPSDLKVTMSALAAMAGRLGTGASTGLAENIVKAFESRNMAEPDCIDSLCTTLAAVTVRMDPLTAAREAASLLSAMEKTSVKDFIEFDGVYPSTNNAYFHRLTGLGITLAVLTKRMETDAHAAQLATQGADRLVSAMRGTQDAYYLGELGKALAVLSRRIETNAAADLATRGAKFLAMGRNDRFNHERVHSALNELTFCMDATVAMRMTTDLVEELANPAETNLDRLGPRCTTVAALARRIDQSAATMLATTLAQLVGNPRETNCFRLSELGKTLAVVSGGVEPSAAVGLANRGAQPLVRAMRNAPVTDIGCLCALGNALGALAGRMETNAAEGVAAQGGQHLVRAMQRERESFRLSELGSALAALTGRMEAEAARRFTAAGAKPLMKALKDPLAAEPVALERLALALEALSARMETSTAAQLATEVIDALKNPDETNLTRLSALGRVLAALSDRMPTSTSTRMYAWSWTLLNPIPPAPMDSSPTNHLRSAFAANCRELSTVNLIEMLKWPFCVGEAQQIVLAELGSKRQGRFSTDFRGSISELIRFANARADIRAILHTPARHPTADGAILELKDAVTQQSLK